MVMVVQEQAKGKESKTVGSGVKESYIKQDMHDNPPNRLVYIGWLSIATALSLSFFITHCLFHSIHT